MPIIAGNFGTQDITVGRNLLSAIPPSLKTELECRNQIFWGEYLIYIYMAFNLSNFASTKDFNDKLKKLVIEISGAPKIYGD